MGRKPVLDELPKFCKLSGIYWAYWSWYIGLAETRVNSLNAYPVYSVQNTEMTRFFGQATRCRSMEWLEPRSGQYFADDSAEGLALLGEFIDCTSE